MHRRQQHINVPIETIRSVVAISETGSLSKAGERLGLSQPAITSQIKQLQGLVGGSLFVRTANGTTATELGRLALQQARLILEANDQLLRLRGDSAVQPLRLGLCTLFVEDFIKTQTAAKFANLAIDTHNSVKISRDLIEGHIDVACIFRNSRMDAEVDQTIVKECDVPLIWVRAQKFVLSPGAPVPILSHPCSDWVIPALTKSRLPYKIVLSSTNYQTRIAAVGAGLGVTAIPARNLPSYLVQAKEYYLPPLPTAKALLCVRPEMEASKASHLIEELSNLFFGSERAPALGRQRRGSL